MSVIPYKKIEIYPNSKRYITRDAKHTMNINRFLKKQGHKISATCRKNKGL